MSSSLDNGGSEEAKAATVVQRQKVKWYRSTFYNMTILGLCNLTAPGIWGAMNSLGGGGAASPYLVNTANAMSFCIMVLSCYFSTVLVHYVGIKWSLLFGTLGYAPYAAGLYCNNKFGHGWAFYLGAAFCGATAGVFWSSEAAIAIAYPEPYNRGKALGYWLTYRLSGQIIGGAVNLGLNANRDQAGQVSYTVFLVFIAIQALGPVVACFLTTPDKVERTDGVEVKLAITNDPWVEIWKTSKLFFRKEFLLLLLLIGQAVFAEAVYFTYLGLWFTVRARALGSFLSAIVAMVGGNILGAWLDRTSISYRTRSRGAFWTIMVLQGAWWTWATVNVTRFRNKEPAYDWSDKGFGNAFAVFILLPLGFQLNYMFLYFVIQNLSKTDEDVLRYSALLRGTESSWQAISYGISGSKAIAQVGGVYLNFGLWAAAILPAWLVIRHFQQEARIGPESTEDGGNSGILTVEDERSKKN